MRTRTKNKNVLESLLDKCKVPLDIDDCASYDDYEWCYYVSDDYSIQVDATFNYNEPNEYEATVMINENDGISKTFEEGEEMDLINFINTDKLVLAEKRALEQIKEDFK